MEQEPGCVDIAGYSFEQFVGFLFQHEVAPGDPWYFDLQVAFDPRKISEHYVRLFHAPEFLRDAYTTPQLDQGFWAIQSCACDCSVQRLMGNDELPFSAKEKCVRSMYDLFARLFAHEPLDTAVQMWWDSLCYEWHCGNRMGKSGREKSEKNPSFKFMERMRYQLDQIRKMHEGEDVRLQEVMFQTLSRILALPYEHCQGAALHGLGHLHHPDTAKLIDDFIASHPSLSDEAKNYALAAARFEVL